MRYNITDVNKNEELFKSLVEASDGKLIIFTVNSLCTSNLRNDLKVLQERLNCDVYYNDLKISDGNRKNTILIVDDMSRLHNLDKSVLDAEFTVASLKEDGVPYFDIRMSFITDYMSFNEDSSGVVDRTVESNPLSRALKCHNVVFVSRVDDIVRAKVKEYDKDYFYIEDIDENERDILESMEYGSLKTLLIKDSCDGDHVDFVKGLIEEGISIVCDLSWMKQFISIAGDANCSFSSTTVYIGCSGGRLPSSKI